MNPNSQAPTFPPRFRVYAAVLGGCIAITLAWVAYIDTTWARYFAGLFSLVIAASTIEGVRRERAVVQNCLLAPGTVTRMRRGRRGAHIRYKCRALDGKKYAGASFRNVRGIQVGDAITVVYASLNPRKNLPRSGFLFYDFNQEH